MLAITINLGIHHAAKDELYVFGVNRNIFIP